MKEASLSVDGARVDSAGEKGVFFRAPPLLTLTPAGAVALPLTPEAVRVVDLWFRKRMKQGGRPFLCVRRC